MKQPIYRSVFLVEVLSPEPYTFTGLGTLAHDVSDGECSGRIEAVKSNRTLKGKSAVKAVLAQGSDPSFFNLDDNGNRTE